jgi:hypothetical protein
MTPFLRLLACTPPAEEPRDPDSTPTRHSAALPEPHSGTFVPLDTGIPGFEITINEVLAEVGEGTVNDANCDGRYGSEDQFVELVNTGTVTVDLTNVTLERAGLPYVWFRRGTVLAPGHALLLFSGGTPGFGATGTEPWCAALPPTVALYPFDRPLDLPECGAFDLVLYGWAGFRLDGFTRDAAPCTGQSLVRSPELDPDAPVVPHGTLSPWPASPGTRADGSPF